MIEQPTVAAPRARAPRGARHTLVALVASLALAGSAAADTFVVDDDGGAGVDFTDIQPAVDAAGPGDLIVVRDGTYTSVLLDAGLRIVADTGHAPEIALGGIEILNVPSGQTVVLAGFEMPSIYVHDCAGTVVLDDDSFGPHSGQTTMRLYRNETVVISRTTVEGQPGWDEGLSPPIIVARRAIEVLETTVVFSACDVQGGKGGTRYKSDGRTGEPAILARDALLFVQTTRVLGGHGGSFWGPDPAEFDCDGGDGAPALSLDRCEVEVFGRSGDLVKGGGGGEPSWLSSIWGISASAIDAVDSDVIHAGSTITTFDGVPVFSGTGSTLTLVDPAIPVLTLDGDGLLGGTLEPVLLAPVGAQFLVWIAPFVGVQQVGFMHTQFLLDPTLLLTLATGTVDATGTYSLPLGVPAGPALQGQALHAQAYVRPTSGSDVLSTSASCVLR